MKGPSMTEPTKRKETLQQSTTTQYVVNLHDNSIKEVPIDISEINATLNEEEDDSFRDLTLPNIINSKTQEKDHMLNEFQDFEFNPNQEVVSDGESDSVSSPMVEDSDLFISDDENDDDQNQHQIQIVPTALHSPEFKKLDQKDVFPNLKMNINFKLFDTLTPNQGSKEQSKKVPSNSNPVEALKRMELATENEISNAKGPAGPEKRLILPYGATETSEVPLITTSNCDQKTPPQSPTAPIQSSSPLISAQKKQSIEEIRTSYQKQKKFTQSFCLTPTTKKVEETCHISPREPKISILSRSLSFRQNKPDPVKEVIAKKCKSEVKKFLEKELEETQRKFQESLKRFEKDVVEDVDNLLAFKFGEQDDSYKNAETTFFETLENEIEELDPVEEGASEASPITPKHANFVALLPSPEKKKNSAPSLVGVATKAAEKIKQEYRKTSYGFHDHIKDTMNIDKFVESGCGDLKDLAYLSSVYDLHRRSKHIIEISEILSRFHEEDEEEEIVDGSGSPSEKQNMQEPKDGFEEDSSPTRETFPTP